MAAQTQFVSEVLMYGWQVEAEEAEVDEEADVADVVDEAAHQEEEVSHPRSDNETHLPEGPCRETLSRRREDWPTHIHGLDVDFMHIHVGGRPCDERRRS